VGVLTLFLLHQEFLPNFCFSRLFLGGGKPLIFPLDLCVRHSAEGGMVKVAKLKELVIGARVLLHPEQGGGDPLAAVIVKVGGRSAWLS